jgi:thioredoxin 1
MKNTIIGCLVFFLFAVSANCAADSAARSAPPPVRPRLVDLGAGKCIPCKLMAPMLAELTKEYAGQLDVVFIDVWKNREEAPRYGISVIPTQIFYDAAGKELFRHEGFFAKKDILAKWAEFGVKLAPPAPKTPPASKKS